MKNKELPIIIKILGSTTMAISMTAITITPKTELNATLNQMLKKGVGSVEIDEIVLSNDAGLNAVAFNCLVDEVPDGKFILNYFISKEEYSNLKQIFWLEPSLKKAKNEQNAIIAVKQILDKYDNPFIQIL